MSEEGTRARRFDIDYLVDLELGRESVVHASGINISSSGLLCLTDYRMEPETQVSLVVTVPSGTGAHTVSCDGVVVRSDRGKGRYLTAIRFTSLADKDAGALEAFLESSQAS